MLPIVIVCICLWPPSFPHQVLIKVFHTCNILSMIMIMMMIMSCLCPLIISFFFYKIYLNRLQFINVLLNRTFTITLKKSENKKSKNTTPKLVHVKTNNEYIHVALCPSLISHYSLPFSIFFFSHTQNQMK